MASNPGKVDLKFLAKRLGLSMTTVSRALNDYPDVSPSTRERVKKVAAEVGYVPSALARRLTSGLTEAVGFVMREAKQYYADPYFAELLSGMSKTLTPAGYDLVTALPLSPEREIDAYRRMVEERRVDAVVLDRVRLDDERVDYLLERRFPFVTFGRDRRADEHAWLDVDNEHAFFEATGRMIANGHRRIAFLGLETGYSFAAQRLAGYRRALAGAGLEPGPVALDADGTEGGQAAAERVLREHPRPDAFVCIDDACAVGCVLACRGAGLAVGRDVSVTGYNDDPLARLIEPPLTTWRISIHEAGAELAGMALRVVNGHDPTQMHVLWRAQAVPRRSDGRAAGGSPATPA